MRSRRIDRLGTLAQATTGGMPNALMTARPYDNPGLLDAAVRLESSAAQ